MLYVCKVPSCAAAQALTSHEAALVLIINMRKRCLVAIWLQRSLLRLWFGLSFYVAFAQQHACLLLHQATAG
jgi:hypothetical protein